MRDTDRNRLVIAASADLPTSISVPCPYGKVVIFDFGDVINVDGHVARYAYLSLSKCGNGYAVSTTGLTYIPVSDLPTTAAKARRMSDELHDYLTKVGVFRARSTTEVKALVSKYCKRLRRSFTL